MRNNKKQMSRKIVGLLRESMAARKLRVKRLGGLEAYCVESSPGYYVYRFDFSDKGAGAVAAFEAFRQLQHLRHSL